MEVGDLVLGEFLYLPDALALHHTGPHVAGGLPFPFRLPGGRRPRPRDRHASELSVLSRRPLPLGHCALSRALQAGRAAASLHQDVHHACTARLQHVFPHLPAQVHAKQSEPTRQSACNRCTYPPRTSACEAERTCHVKQSEAQATRGRCVISDHHQQRVSEGDNDSVINDSVINDSVINDSVINDSVIACHCVPLSAIEATECHVLSD